MFRPRVGAVFDRNESSWVAPGTLGRFDLLQHIGTNGPALYSVASFDIEASGSFMAVVQRESQLGAAVPERYAGEVHVWQFAGIGAAIDACSSEAQLCAWQLVQRIHGEPLGASVPYRGSYLGSPQCVDGGAGCGLPSLVQIYPVFCFRFRGRFVFARTVQQKSEFASHCETGKGFRMMLLY